MIALGKPFAILRNHQRNVGPARHRLAKEPVQEDLPGRGGQQIGPAQDLRDAHRAVVHHHRELVGEHAVGALKHEIPHQLLGIERLRAANFVVKREGPVRNAQADRRGPRPAALLALRAGEAPAGSRVPRPFVALGSARCRRDFGS